MKRMMYVMITLVAIILAFVLLDGSFMPSKYNSVYNESYINTLDTDAEKIIAYAIGASSGHNMQPWLVKILDENTVELYADMDKQLLVIDANHNQLLMSQGTFIQKFMEGAGEYGYSATVEYMETDLNSLVPLIAQIKIEKVNEIKVDTISAGTVAVDDTAEIIDIIQSIDSTLSEYDNLSYEYINQEDELIQFKNMLLLGTIAESEDIAATEELLSVFRWTEYQKNKYRYGLSLNSMPSIIKPFIQPIMTVTSKNTEAFGQSSIKMFEDRLEKDLAYILIKCDSAQSIDHIKAGEAYQALISKLNGYSIRPAVQLLEEFDAMEELNDKFQHDYGGGGEVLLILTVQLQSGASSSNPRHLVEDIILE